MLALAGEAGFIERLFDGGVARVHHQGQRVDAGVLFAAALHVCGDGGADAAPLRLGKLRRGLDLLVALQQLHGHPGGGRGEVLVALVLVAADVAVLRLRGVVVVALHLVAVLAVFVEVKGAVAVPAAQRGDDLLQRAAGAFVVAAHHVGDDGAFGLMVDGLKKRLEALSLLGGNGHHRRAEQPRKGLAVGVDAAPLQLVHEVEGDDHGALQFHQLQREIEVALDVGGVDDVQNHVRRVLGDEVAGDVFLDGIGRKRVDAGQIDQSGLFALQVKMGLLALHGDAGPVAHILVGAGEGVEQRGLAAVGVARQSDGDAHACALLTYILRASSARSVSV